MNMQMQNGMSEKDVVNMILADEKRTAGEYATATLEANCQTVHSTFNQLLQNTLKTQRQVFEVMQQQGWYSSPSTAMSQDVQKQVQQAQQTKQQTDQFVGQHGMQTSAQQSANGAVNAAVMQEMMQNSSQAQARNSQRPM